MQINEKFYKYAYIANRYRTMIPAHIAKFNNIDGVVRLLSLNASFGDLSPVQKTT